MSFRVNTNVTAQSALRSVGLTNMELGKSITRLSTGLRINSGADDPSGLIASEHLRNQIASVDAAIRNNNDAFNYVSAAEAALDEVNRLLRDARAVALAATNAGALSGAQVQASQNQLSSIVQSITRIAQTTQFGSKKPLDGSAGILAAITAPANLSRMVFGGNFNNVSIATDSLVTVEVATAATQATLTGSVTFANTTDPVTAGSFAINGRTFNTTATMTVAEVVSMVNAASSSTGVSATHTAGGGVVFTAVDYGTTGNFTLSDSGVLNAAGTVSATGIDAMANVTLDTNGTTAGGLVTVTFRGGRYGQGGLMLSDTNGNSMTLTAVGNVVGAAYNAGNLTVGSTQYQIGPNVGQTVAVSIGDFSATQLGRYAVQGMSLADVDVTTIDGANNAIRIIDAAVDEVTQSRGDLGNLQHNLFETNVRSLGALREGLMSSESYIRDTDLAAEMTAFTRLQILQQSGMAALAQANAAPQLVLQLLNH